MSDHFDSIFGRQRGVGKELTPFDADAFSVRLARFAEAVAASGPRASVVHRAAVEHELAVAVAVATGTATRKGRDMCLFFVTDNAAAATGQPAVLARSATCLPSC